jgi:hypothetical protein
MAGPIVWSLAALVRSLRLRVTPRQPLRMMIGAWTQRRVYRMSRMVNG